jgi:hypothetical protein
LEAKKTYLKGKSIFIVSLLVVGITALTVYLTGTNYDRTITANLYLSLGITGTALFLFMAYGLFTGVGLQDNFPKFQQFKTGEMRGQSLPDFETPEISADDGIGGLIISILLWVGITILVIALLVLLEAVFWFSLFILLAMLYWVFFRALKFVFNQSHKTKGNIGNSILYSMGYTVLYLGWIVGVVYLTEVLK